MAFSRGYYKILGLAMLQHFPHSLNIFFCISPVPLCFQISKNQLVFFSSFYCSQAADNFFCDKGVSPSRAFVVEQYAVACKQAVCLPVIYCNPVCKYFCACIGASRIEWRIFVLRGPSYFAEHLRAGTLVKLYVLFV